MLAELAEVQRSSDRSGIRYHELALQRWLNQNFFVVEGYPVPVVFTSPMDAYSHFKQLWGLAEGNPFSYLLEAKDDKGTPIYRPHPAPPAYPLISVFRRDIRWRTEQSYSIHRWRRLSWPTLKTSGTNLRDQLGTVATARMPMAWDFEFQVDFYCLRPDTMAIFVEHFMRTIYRAGGIPQTWITVAYPYYGPMFARTYLQGGTMRQMTPEAAADGQPVIFRVSATLVMEGWVPDIKIELVPAFWNLVLSEKIEVAPGELETVYSQTIDLRTPQITNPVMVAREDDLPPYE